MEAYYNQLSSRPESQRDLELRQFMNVVCVYDPDYDYLPETYPYMIRFFKQCNPRSDDVELAVRNTLWETPPKDGDYHKRVYNWWLGYKREQFLKTWKPRDNDGLNYLFITLNYASDLPISQVSDETNRIINLPIFSNCKITYCFEYYTDNGCHPHVHMLVELKRTGTLSMSVILDKIYQKKTLKPILKVDIKMSWAAQINKRAQKRAVCLAYVTGQKIDGKQENVEKDKQWRQINNIFQDTYIKDNN